VRIPAELVEQIVAHAREEAPNECCGMIASRDGEAVRVFRARNEAASPLRYVVDPRDLHRITTEIEDAGWQLGAIYHSHTRSDPYPSQTDVNTAFFPDSDDPLWPGTLYVIVGVAGPDANLRAYRIAARDRVEDVELEVVR
jgi:proteasome lid subunit RPN8/RPN11